jgi:hypothetical protein
VCVEDTDADFRLVTDRATGRIGDAVHRALERHKAAWLSSPEGANRVPSTLEN